MRRTDGMRQGWLGYAAAVVTVVGVVPGPTTVTTQQPLSVDDVVARAATYVETFIQQLSSVVMEEDYGQTYFGSGSASPVHTQVESEFLLMQVQGVGEWVGFRDVFKANGQQIRDRQDRLASLFLGDTADALAQARRITEESARYNLGTTNRTFNVPTYALFFLHPANTSRSRFEKDDEGCAGVDTAWDIRFEEIVYPTMSTGFQGIDLPAHGRFCLDPESGRVYETELELHHPSVRDGRPATDAKAQVKFALEPKLDLWVPVEMSDSYLERGGGRMISSAKYRNYRQFNVSVSENTDPETGAEPPE
jgi:hypothetical protein